MLAGASHAHKVNFCKFTNETRNGIEDSSENSGGKRFARSMARRPAAATSSHWQPMTSCWSMTALLLFPCLNCHCLRCCWYRRPTRVPQAKVRRDHADFFCTTEEGVRENVHLIGRLVDESRRFPIRISGCDARARIRGHGGNGAQGHQICAAPPHFAAARCRRTARFPVLHRRGRIATVTLRGPDAPPPAICRGHGGAGYRTWLLQLARELDDAILHIRLNEFDVAAIVFSCRAIRRGGGLRTFPRRQQRPLASARNFATSGACVGARSISRPAHRRRRSSPARALPARSPSCRLPATARTCSSAGAKGDNKPPAAVVIALTAANPLRDPMSNG